jgi:cysteine desulfurase
MRVYLDNAAGTPLDKTVFKAMVPYLQDQFGHPTAQHSHGAELKLAIANARERIGHLLGATPGEIHFTNGGKDELIAAIEVSGTDHLITTDYADALFLQSLQQLKRRNNLRVSFIRHRDRILDLQHLEFLLRTNTRNFISVPHLDPRTGNLNPLEEIASLATHYKAHLHVDATHTMGRAYIDLRKVNFLSAKANRFHGPNGVGLFYNRKDTYNPLPEVDLCVSYIAGLTIALEAAYENLALEAEYVGGLKARMRYHFEEFIPDAEVVSDPDNGLFTALTVKFPRLFEHKSLQQYLDEQQVSVGGSNEPGFDIIHFSFSKLNTPEEIDYVTDNLTSLYERVSG